MGYPAAFHLYTLTQIHNCSMVTLLSDLRVHWYPVKHFPNYLQSNTTRRKKSALVPLPTTYNLTRPAEKISPGTLRMRSVYLILISKSNLELISRRSNATTIIYLIIEHINVGELTFQFFCLDAARIDLWMTRISACYSSAVLSPFYIS